MAPVSEWTEAALIKRGVRPSFAKILVNIPPIPPIDVVSDKNALQATRQMLDNADVPVVIPNTIERTKIHSNTPVHIYRKKEKRVRPVIFIIGGGGFVVGNPAMMATTACGLVEELDVVCICLGYRHAPEHPFPAALIDILGHMENFIEKAAEYDIDTSQLALYGQSAGGDLAVLAAVAWAERGKHALRSLILSSPCSPEEMPHKVDEKLSSQGVDWCWNVQSHTSALLGYQKGKDTSTFPYMHSSQVPDSSLATLPPTYVHIPQLDFLRNEALALGHRLLDVGVPTTIDVRKGDVHIGLDLFFSHPDGAHSRQGVVQHLRETLSFQPEEKVPVPKPTSNIPKFPIDVSADTVTAIVQQYNSQTDNVRLREILDVLVKHLHAFTREINLSTAEWMAGIQFLTQTGQICSDIRQEFILLSDVLGLSVLVDSINHKKPPQATPSTVLGPFFTEDAPDIDLGSSIVSDGKSHKGTAMLVRGRILDVNGKGIAGASIETWETDSDGFYDTQYDSRTEADFRGRLKSAADGTYTFRAIVPVSYPIPSDGPVGKLLETLKRHVFRPAHLHMMIEAQGYDTLVTALYPRDDLFLQSDAVLGVKSALVCVSMMECLTYFLIYILCPGSKNNQLRRRSTKVRHATCAIRSARIQLCHDFYLC